MSPTSSGRLAAAVGALIVFAPVLIPAAFVLVLALFVLGAMVVGAFADGFESACGALAALIGIPSVLVLWLRAAGPVLGIPRRRVAVAPTPRDFGLPRPVAELYAAGEFLHRDYEAERREREAERRAWEADLDRRRAERARLEG